MTKEEEIRHGIIHALYPTRALRVPVNRLTRLLTADGITVTDAEVSAELRFLASLTPPLVDFEADKLGSTTYWRITADGVLLHERGR